MKAFVAQYDGSACALCGELIYADEDHCVYVDDNLCHAECAENEGEHVEWD